MKNKKQLELDMWVEKKFRFMYKKFIKSRTWFATLNIISFFLIASLIILNLYSIKKNPFQETKIFFLLISILSTAVGALIAIASLFAFKKRYNEYKESAIQLAKEYKMYKAGVGEYEFSNKTEVFIANFDRIIT